MVYLCLVRTMLAIPDIIGIEWQVTVCSTHLNTIITRARTWTIENKLTEEAKRVYYSPDWTDGENYFQHLR